MKSATQWAIVRKWAALVTSGGILLQTTSCTDIASVVTAVATSVSAGGVLYIIRQIME